MILLCPEGEQVLSVLYKAPVWQLDSQISSEERERLVLIRAFICHTLAQRLRLETCGWQDLERGHGDSVALC